MAISRQIFGEHVDMVYFCYMISENLKYLRKRDKISQQDLSDKLDIPRTTLGDYERGKTEPSINTIINLAQIFNVKIDALLKEDLSHMDLEVIRNKELRVLAISVDQDNNGNIELVDTKAQAGYLQSFSDPEYIRELPKIHFPDIPEGTYRGFKIAGDSMLPVEPGSVVICSYVESLDYLKEGRTYIIVSQDEGLVYKRVQKLGNRLILHSDNALYPPYEIPFQEVAEAWEFYALLSFNDSQSSADNQVDAKLDAIQRKLNQLDSQIQTMGKA